MNDPELVAAARRNLLATLALPALLIVSAYLLLMRPDMRGSIDQVALALDEARRQAPSPDVLGEAHDRVFALKDALRIESEQRARLASEVASADATAQAAIERPVWRREFADLMGRHRIVVQSDHAEEVTATTGTRQKIRRLELRGSYADVLAALDEFARAQPGGRVLELTMKRPKDGGSATAWTLTIG